MYRISTDPDIELAECSRMPHHGMLEFGMSIGLHAVGVMSILLIAMVSSPPPVPADTPFVTVRLVESVAEGNGMTMDPFPGAGNGASPRTADVVPEQNPQIPHVATTIPKPQPTVDSKPRKSARKRTADISSNLSKPVHKMETKPVPSDRSDNVDEISAKQSNASADATDSEKMLRGDDGIGTGSEVQGGNRLGSASGTGSGAVSGTGTGSGSGSGSGIGNASLDLGGGSAPAYHLKQVDQPPIPVEKVDPEFPQAARKLGVTGKVMVKFLVKADGNVQLASILEADPEGIFDGSALDAINKWRFKPGVYRGKAVATWVILPVHFRLIR